MGARHELGVANVLQRTVIGARNTDLGQLVCHVTGPRNPPIAGFRQALAQRGIVWIEAQAHDVHGNPGKGDRDLRPCQVGHARCMGGCDSPVLAADFVMVGE